MTHHARAIFGFALLGIWAALIAVIALGKVEAATSYGLLPCITALAGLSGAYAQSTFSNPAVSKTSKKKSKGGGDNGTNAGGS